MICNTTRQNETIVNLFHSRFNQEQYSNEKIFFNNPYCFSQTLVGFQEEATVR